MNIMHFEPEEEPDFDNMTWTSLGLGPWPNETPKPMDSPAEEQSQETREITAMIDKALREGAVHEIDMANFNLAMGIISPEQHEVKVNANLDEINKIDNG